MNDLEKYEKIKEIVKYYYDSNFAASSDGYLPSDDGEEHIISIGTSIICTKYNIGPKGGSFVQAIIDNDLELAINTADSTNTRAIRFYIWLAKNTWHLLYNADLIGAE